MNCYFIAASSFFLSLEVESDVQTLEAGRLAWDKGWGRRWGEFSDEVWSNLDAGALGHWGLPVSNLGHNLFLLLKKELWWQNIVQYSG